MKPVKNFKEFKDSIMESWNLVGFVKGALKRLNKVFVGSGSAFLNGMEQQEKGWPRIEDINQRTRFSDSVRLIGSKEDVEILRKNGINVVKGLRGNFLRLLGGNKSKVDWKMHPIHVPSKVHESYDSFEKLLEEERIMVENLEGYVPESAEHALIAFHCFNPIDTRIEPINEASGVDSSEDENDYIALKHPRIPNANIAKLKKLIATCIHAEDEGSPLLIWGAPGIGKTAIIRQVAENVYDKRFIDYDLMTMMPEDFALPIPGRDDEGKVTKKSKLWKILDGVLPFYPEEEGKTGDDTVNGKNGGVLFFDEIARCRPSVQGACLKITDENRRIGNFKLGSKWSVICAANRAEDDQGGESSFNFNKTLGNRFAHCNFAPDFDEWDEWASHPDTKTKNGEPLIDKEVLTFLRFYQKHFHRLSNIHADEYNWPSPRSWTLASKNIRAAIKAEEKLRQIQDGEKAAKLSKKEIREIKVRTLESLVGIKAAGDFLDFMTLLEKVPMSKIENVFKNPDDAPKWHNLRMDEIDALLGAISMASERLKPIKDEHLRNFGKYLIAHSDMETAPSKIVLCLKMMQRIHPEIKENPIWYGEGGVKEEVFDAYKAFGEIDDSF